VKAIHDIGLALAAAGDIIQRLEQQIVLDLMKLNRVFPEEGCQVVADAILIISIGSR
jgi:hypothetical protein